MRRRRYKAYTGDRMARFRDNFIHFKAWQLAAFARLCALCNLYLYFVSVDQILPRHTETTRCNLLRFAGKRDAFSRSVEAFCVFSAFAGVATCSQFVHSHGQSFMCFLRECAERHGPYHKMLHNFSLRFYLINVDRVALKVKEVAQKQRLRLIVYKLFKVLKRFIVACSCG